MGVNKIAKMDLPFTLTHYVKVDHARFDEDTWQSQVFPVAATGARLLLWDAFRDGDGSQEILGIGDLLNTTWVSRCKKHHYYSYPDDKAAISWHLPQLCTAVNSISIMAQWAVMLGFSPIYLVGCDAGYSDGVNDHFCHYYQSVDREYAARNNRNVMHAHKVIRRSCPVPVFNATIGGRLDMYPRVKLENVIYGY
jgi:hypothetical protein